MADDELDELYWVKLEDFTETRSRLAAAAKDRGDAAGAKEISGSRKPTTAAWVVNRLALSRSKAKQRLTDLGQRLREAHAAMDGAEIRELSAQQRKLIDELSRAAFDAAELKNPSASIREDVTATLQAAIADPDVAARLGRLAKAEHWSGFGDFGVIGPASSAPKSTQRKESKKAEPRGSDQIDRARAALAKAEEVKAEADAALSAARKRVDNAEREWRAAQDAHDEAKRASREAAELVKKAKAELNQARG